MAVTYVIKFDVNPDLSVWEPLQGDRSQMPNQHQLTAVFRWVRPRPRGQTLGGDPCLSTGDTREALPARAQAHQLGRTHLRTL
jgi:hypothetical protein